MVKFDPLDNYYPEIIASPHTAPVRTDEEIAEDEVSFLADQYDFVLVKEALFVLQRCFDQSKGKAFLLPKQN